MKSPLFGGWISINPWIQQGSSMRPSFTSVPRQLQSASLRYVHALGDRATPARPPGWGGTGAGENQRSGPEIGTECERDERLRRLEAILLLAREPLSSRRLSQYSNLADATEARTLVRHLNELLDGSGRAFRVEEVAGGFQLLT